MMHLYLKNGQRALAVRQYEQCCQALKSELNIAPMLETQRVYQHLLDEPELVPEEGKPDHSSLEKAVDQLQNALELLDHAQQQVQKAAATVNLEVRLKHYGYLSREQRMAIYEWYRTRDPHIRLEDEYRHLAEIPGAFHAPGPAVLVPWEE